MARLWSYTLQRCKRALPGLKKFVTFSTAFHQSDDTIINMNLLKNQQLDSLLTSLICLQMHTQFITIKKEKILVCNDKTRDRICFNNCSLRTGITSPNQRQSIKYRILQHGDTDDIPTSQTEHSSHAAQPCVVLFSQRQKCLYTRRE